MASGLLSILRSRSLPFENHFCIVLAAALKVFDHSLNPTGLASGSDWSRRSSPSTWVVDPGPLVVSSTAPELLEVPGEDNGYTVLLLRPSSWALVVEVSSDVHCLVVALGIPWDSGSAPLVGSPL